MRNPESGMRASLRSVISTMMGNPRLRYCCGANLRHGLRMGARLQIGRRGGKGSAASRFHIFPR
jgi:hypothetical protein